MFLLLTNHDKMIEEYITTIINYLLYKKLT